MFTAVLLQDVVVVVNVLVCLNSCVRVATPLSNQHLTVKTVHVNTSYTRSYTIHCLIMTTLYLKQICNYNRGTLG